MIVICPPAVGDDLPHWVHHLDARVLDVAATSDDEWVACVALQEIPALATVVAYGRAVRLLPSLAFANRASRRPLGHYVLVDCDLPEASTSDWPDAPVTVVTTVPEVLNAAKLRGWNVSATIQQALI